ncbi:MAG: hypothetical protein M3137_00915 [Actinomycetota bacterium]|nr:hypothetical protein [Actinomycetota bacterium]
MTSLLTAFRFLRQTIPHLLEGVVGPSVAFLAGHAVWGMFGALGLAFAWTGTCLGLRLIIGRRVTGLLIIAGVSLLLRTVVAVVMNSTTAFFIGPDIVTAGMGLMFVASACTSKPLVARIAGDFLPAAWLDLGNRRALRLCRAGSALWGFEQLLTSCVTGFMVFKVSPTTFVTCHEPISIAVFTLVMGIALPFFWGDIKALRGPPGSRPVPGALAIG